MPGLVVGVVDVRWRHLAVRSAGGPVPITGVVPLMARPARAGSGGMIIGAGAMS